MTQIPPNWAFIIYSKLWAKFKDNRFYNEQAKQIIQGNLNQAISRLKNDGWLKIGLDPKDSRKSIYILKNPEHAINEIIDEYSQK